MKIEINHLSKFNDNIFIRGNIVQHTFNPDWLIMVRKSENDTSFSGMQIGTIKEDSLAQYSITWPKQSYKQFQGKITIEI